MDLLLSIASAGRKTLADNRKAEQKEIADKLQLASKDDFFLRATSEGYDWGKNPDPDNLLPTKYGAKKC